MKKLNVNGKIYTDTNIINIYNLFNYMLYAVDIYVCSSSNEALSWIMTPNSDTTSKFTLVIDGPNGEIHNMQFGSPGESFSNPITYIRDSGVPETTMQLPSNEDLSRKPVYLIAGSNKTELGSNWWNLPEEILEDGVPIENNHEIAWSHGVNIDFENSNKDDKIILEIIRNTSTDFDLFEKYIEKIIFVIHPSAHKKLKKTYFYFDYFPNDNDTNIDESIGVVY